MGIEKKLKDIGLVWKMLATQMWIIFGCDSEIDFQSTKSANVT